MLETMPDCIWVCVCAANSVGFYEEFLYSLKFHMTIRWWYKEIWRISLKNTLTHTLLPGQKSHVCQPYDSVSVSNPVGLDVILFSVVTTHLLVFGQGRLNWIFLKTFLFTFLTKTCLLILLFLCRLSLSLSPSVLMASGVEIQDVDHLLVQTTTNYYIWFSKNLIMKMKSLSPALPPCFKTSRSIS